MAVERAKVNTTIAPKRSRLEVNVRQLLNKCEKMAKEEPIDANCRLHQYVKSLNEMIAELKIANE